RPAAPTTARRSDRRPISAAARASAPGCPTISARKGSGNSLNDFMGPRTLPVRCLPMGTKISIVGGGSTYTPELVEGFVTHRDRLPVDELVLLDPDVERLDAVGGLARRILGRTGWTGKLTATADRDEALDGADFLVVQLRIGGQAARLVDETLPLRFGCVGQETTGPGGFAKALRTVPVVLELAEAFARRAAPGAWLVDFTNPVGIVTQALLEEGHRAVGLCNVAIG